MPDRRFSIVFFGSGEFGLPTLAALEGRDDVNVVRVVTQPDRPAGRHRQTRATPIGQWAQERAVRLLKSVDVNDPSVVETICGAEADAFVVIAFGQKLGPALLGDTFAINLHGSLLPKYRGAAPVQRAMMAGESRTGASVISLAQRMDAGLIYATAETEIRDDETAGELEMRLAALGPAVVGRVLDDFRAGTLRGVEQDEAQAIRAPRLCKEEGTTDFDAPADLIRARIHGLTPWPGCTVLLDGREIKVVRACARREVEHDARPGTIQADLTIACRSGAVEIVEVQPAGGRVMDLTSFRNGHVFEPGMRFRSRDIKG